MVRASPISVSLQYLLSVVWLTWKLWVFPLNKDETHPKTQKKGKPNNTKGINIMQPKINSGINTGDKNNKVVPTANTRKKVIGTQSIEL